MAALLPRLFRLVLGLVLLTALGGCDSFDPYAKTERSFSLFGIVKAKSQRHPVLVEPLQDGRPFTADSTIDATVTITNVETGRELALEHRRSRLGDGFRHNFFAKLNPKLGATYRVTARPSDGRPSTATLTIPSSVPELSLVARGTGEDVTLRALVEEAGQDRLLFLTVSYRVRIKPAPTPSMPRPDPFETTLKAQYGPRATPTETGYSATLDWETDVDSVYGGSRPATATLLAVSANVGLVHPSAPDYGTLTYDELFEVGAAPSNVENGYGYVAGTSNDGASITVEQRPSTGLPCGGPGC